MDKTCRTFPPEVSRIIASFDICTPTAAIVKELTFEYLPVENPGGGVYRAARLKITAPLFESFFPCGEYPWKVRPYREYILSDFGTSEYDRYTIESDIASGLQMGRVLN